MRKILVPLDGSAFAEQAIETARNLAARDQAVLEFVSVARPVPSSSRVGAAPPIDRTMDLEQREAARSYLARMEEAARARDGIEVRSRLREGAPAREIVAQAAEGGADLIVMTSHGRGGVDRLWLGSVADAVIRSSSGPVMIIRVDPVGTAMAGSIRRVVVGVAGEEADDRVLASAVAVAGLSGVDYMLVHALSASPMLGTWNPTVSPSPEDLSASRPDDGVRVEAAMRYLAKMAETLREQGALVETRVPLSQSPPRAIVDAARDSGADLIAVGTVARPPLARMLLGSTADKVIRTAPCHVLVCPPVQ